MKITNLAPYDVENLWGYQSGTGSPDNIQGIQCRSMVASSAIVEACLATLIGVQLIQGHTYYFKYLGYQNQRTEATTDVYWPIAEPSLFHAVPLGEAGKWNVYSGVRKITEFASGLYQIRIDFNNVFQDGTLYVSSPVLVDLTESFGDGNEPDKQWCDSNIPFFSGSLEIDVIFSPSIGISSASLTPNPSDINSLVVLSVVVVESPGLMIPYKLYSGDLYAGEV